MFADFPSIDMLFGIHDHAVKDHQFFRYKAKPDLVIKLTKDRLDPEPGRTSHACGIRLSQNKENNARRAFVNKNARVFAPSREALATLLGSSRRGDLVSARQPITDFLRRSQR